MKIKWNRVKTSVGYDYRFGNIIISPSSRFYRSGWRVWKNYNEMLEPFFTRLADAKKHAETLIGEKSLLKK